MRRVSVTDPIGARRYADADAFEVALEGADRCSPEEWVHRGSGRHAGVEEADRRPRGRLRRGTFLRCRR